MEFPHIRPDPTLAACHRGWKGSFPEMQQILARRLPEIVGAGNSAQRRIRSAGIGANRAGPGQRPGSWATTEAIQIPICGRGSTIATMIRSITSAARTIETKRGMLDTIRLVH
jgi:hypothetical protein